MEVGLGHMGFSPAVFWAMSLTEWRAAYRGYRHKVTGESADAPGAMTRADLDALIERCAND